MDKEVKEMIEKQAWALRDACGLYHEKNSKGAGGASICVCGAGCGGSYACGALARLTYIARDVLAGKKPTGEDAVFLETLAW